jgi:hypothetical protein
MLHLLCPVWSGEEQRAVVEAMARSFGPRETKGELLCVTPGRLPNLLVSPFLCILKA